MSEVAAYTPRDLDRPDLLDPVTDSWVASIAEVAQLAAYICETPFVPMGLRGNAPATAATILYGREIGVPPITALQTMHVINGRVGMAAELMRARVLAAGHEIEVVESTTAVCRMRGRRRGSDRWAEVQWTKGDAATAGLRGDGWTKYPRAMLVARASAELCRLVFPDVTHGMLATEEIGDDTPAPASAGVSSTSPRRVARAARVSPSKEPPSGETEPPSTPPSAAAPESPRGEVATPRAAPPPEVPEPPARVDSLPTATRAGAEPPPLDEPERMPGEVPLPIEVVDDHGTEHPAPLVDPVDQVIEVEPLVLVGDEADPRAMGRLHGDGPATRPQQRHVMALLRRLGIGASREERLHVGQALVGRRVSTFSDLTVTDAGRMITTLLIALDSDDPRAMLRHIVDEEHRRLAEAEADTGVGDE